jgi:hypothetical protein
VTIPWQGSAKLVVGHSKRGPSSCLAQAVTNVSEVCPDHVPTSHVLQLSSVRMGCEGKAGR